jgi:hypothetical protein
VNLKRAREHQAKLRGRGVHDRELALQRLHVLARATEQARDLRWSTTACEELDDVAFDRFAFAAALTFDAH